MELIAVPYWFALFALLIVPVISEGVKSGYQCENAKYRLFVLRTTPQELWHGTLEEAETMCTGIGHFMASDTSCISQFFQSTDATDTFGSSDKKIWVDQSLKTPNETKCAYWSNTTSKVVHVECSERLAVMCLGLAATSGDYPIAKAYPGEKPEEDPTKKTSGVDAYYVLCGILGVVLIAIVVAAAIWRSGYVNNRYSFRRMPTPAEPPPSKKKFTPKSETVTSQLDSEVPQGYVKASVTKETIA